MLLFWLFYCESEFVYVQLRINIYLLVCFPLFYCNLSEMKNGFAGREASRCVYENYRMVVALFPEFVRELEG